jgi:hypothetical protein
MLAQPLSRSTTAARRDIPLYVISQQKSEEVVVLAMGNVFYPEKGTKLGTFVSHEVHVRRVSQIIPNYLSNCHGIEIDFPRIGLQ